MANFSLRTLLVHLFAFLDTLQRSFWNHAPQPLLSALFPLLIEAGPELSPIAHVTRGRDLPDYTTSVDLSTTCLLPTIFQTPSTMNICSIDHPELPHFYVSLGSIPVQREDESSPLPQSELVESDRARTDVESYGARGLSFCPVLLGFTYLHSLLHLYMFLMIPSFVNHWFEDVSSYESLGPAGLSSCSPGRLLHTSLLVVPWYLVRHGLRKVFLCLYCRLRRATHKSTHSSIPRIVLIRVDGEAVPVHFIEDHPGKGDVGEQQTFASEDSETRNEVSDGGNSKDVMRSDIPDDGFIFEALPMSTVSQQCESQGRIASSHDRIGPEPLSPEAVKDLQHSVIANDKQWETSPDRIRAGNEPLQHVDELDGLGQLAFSGGIVDDLRDQTNTFGEQEDSNQHACPDPQSLIDGYGPYESGTSSATLRATSSSVSQDTLTPEKNVRIAYESDPDETVTVEWRISSPNHMGEHTSAWDLGGLLGDDDDALIESPVAPSDPSTDAQSPTQVTELILQEGNDEQGVDALFAELLSPFLTGKPIVNLPALVATREDAGAVVMDPVVHVALVEDVATRSPIQIPAPNGPAVVVNINCLIETDEAQSLTVGTGELAPNQVAEVSIPSDIASPREDASLQASPFIKGSHPICSPIINSKSLVGNVRPMETALPGSASVSETGFPLTHADPVVTNTSTGNTRGVPREGVEVIYDKPKQVGGHSVKKDFPDSPRNDLQGIGTSPLHTSVEIHATATDSLLEPGAEQIIISDQYLELSCAVVVELPTARQPEWTLGSLDTCEGIILLSTSAGNATDELCDGKSHKDDVTLSDPASPQPCPQRTLSGSIHAPPSLGTLSTPQAHSRIGQASALGVSLPLAGCKDVTVTENASEQAQDLSASIHAPKKISKSEAPSPGTGSRNGDGRARDHCRSITNPVTASEEELSKPGSPNWIAMPEVADAFRMFKNSHSENGIRRASSISECRGPMAGIVGQKGIATNSLNNASTIAHIQGRWKRGGGLLLVRDLVPSDPADFNLRTCTNMRSSKIHRTDVSPMRPVLHPGLFHISPFMSQHEITRHTIGVEADFSALAPDSAEIRQQQSMLASRGVFGS